MKTKISLIIPVYNAGSRIQNCLQSALNQSYENLEIICVDDGSVDESADLIEALKDPRIKLIRQANAGVSAARNRGLEEASGEYVCFLDADDALESDHIALLAQAMEEEKPDLVICSFKEQNGDQLHPASSELNGLYNIHDAFWPAYRAGLINRPWNKLYLRKNITEGFPLGIQNGEDLQFNLKYLQHNPRVYFTDQSTYHYHVSQTGLSSAPESCSDFFEVYERLFAFQRPDTEIFPFQLRHYIRFSTVNKLSPVSGMDEYLAFLSHYGKKMNRWQLYLQLKLNQAAYALKRKIKGQ